MELSYLLILDNTKKLRGVLKCRLVLCFYTKKVGISDRVISTWVTHYVREVGNYRPNIVLSLFEERI